MQSIRTIIKPWITPLLWIGAYLIVAGFIGDMTRSEIPDWYRALQKPDLNPPDVVFPIVWTTLYIMIAIVGWRIWRQRNIPGGKLIFGLFIVQTLFNWIWSYLFFDFHWLGFSFFWIIALDIFVAALIFLLRRFDRISSWLLVPYFFWICFASYLNGMIWHLN